MKKILLVIFLLGLTDCMLAQAPEAGRKFSPEEFRHKQEDFITKNAGLSPMEAAQFFPLFHELGMKKFKIDRKIRSCVRKAHDSSLSESEAREILTSIDKLEIEKARLTRGYHVKFAKVLSSTKLLKVIDADSRFSRMLLRKIAPFKAPKDR